MLEINSGADVEEQPSSVVVAAVVPIIPNLEEFSNTDGIELGYAMIATAVIGFLASFFSFLATITLGSKVATIVLSSSIACKCCCASDYKLIPVTRMYAALTLSMISTQFVVTFIYIYIVQITVGEDAYEDIYFEPYKALTLIFIYIILALEILTVLFACLYTFIR